MIYKITKSQGGNMTTNSEKIRKQKTHIVSWLASNGYPTNGGVLSSLLWQIATSPNLGHETKRGIATRTSIVVRAEVMESRIQRLLNGPNPALVKKRKFIHLSPAFQEHWETRPHKGPLKTRAWPNGPKAINPTPPKRKKETTP